VIFKQVQYDFDYDLEVPIKGLSPGGLLFAVLYNLKVDMFFEPMDVYVSTPYASNSREEVVAKF
jgi:hypothetical protein